MLASPARAMIYVVDDDPDVLGSLQFLLETDGFDVRTFKSGAALLRDGASDDADCFVIDAIGTPEPLSGRITATDSGDLGNSGCLGVTLGRCSTT